VTALATLKDMTSFPSALGRGVDTLLDRTVVPGFTKIGLAVRKRLPGWPEDPAPGSMTGRTVAVTGATSGLGLATAEGLGRLGANLLLVVRDVPKGERVLAELRQDLPGVDARVVRCDVADLDDVRRFARELDADEVDVLVHNAGALPTTRTESPQGHELTMAVHVLGPVLMTELLRDRLAGHDARVVFVSSGGMYGQALRADDPEYASSSNDGKYSGTTAYARSKRAQVELLPILAGRWGEGTPEAIGVHATHPGWATTPGVTEALPAFDKVMGSLFRTPAGGADTTVWLSAVQPQPSSGQLWHDRRARSTHFLPRTRTSEQERARMWAWVSEQTGI
jgi:NAD(P)-dependent dehydrogenase (short-subunit alcohol dehydrogenase family)